MKFSFMASILFSLFLVSCNTPYLDDNKHKLARKKADDLMEKLQSGNARAEFAPEYFAGWQIGPLLSMLHDSCRYDHANAVLMGENYQKYIGRKNELLFYYKYYLKSDSLRVTVVYYIDDSAKLFHIGVQQLR